jgi:hypothetical protein
MELFGQAHVMTIRAGLALALDRLELGGNLAAAEIVEALDRAEAGQGALDPHHSRLGEIELARARLALAQGDADRAVQRSESAAEQIAARLGASAPGVTAARGLREAALARSRRS